MEFKSHIKEIFVLVFLMTTVYGCLNVAKISDFPKTSSAINFDKYSSEYQENKTPFWTTETSNEYYIERNIILTENDLTDIIKYALVEYGYEIKAIDLDSDYVIGERGIYANEWKSITGVYYKIDYDKKKFQVYINTKITQDFTGGWGENRAKKVGLIIEKIIDLKENEKTNALQQSI